MSDIEPANLFLLIRSLDAGGAERQMVRTANALSARGHRVRLGVFYGGGPLGSQLDRGVQLVDLGKRGRYDTAGFALRLRRALTVEPLDSVFCSLPPACIAGLLSRTVRSRPRLVWRIAVSWMDLSSYDRLSRWSYKAQAALSPLADAIVVNSRAGLDYALGFGFPERRLRVIQNGIDVEAFRPVREGRRSHELPTIAIVARLDPVKNHSLFLQAVSVFLSRGGRARFVALGDGSAEAARKFDAEVARLGLGAHVRRVAAADDMADFYPSITINTLTSVAEGFPNVLGEAMACGIPCVSTDVGDAREIIGETGRVCGESSADCIAAAWSELLDSGDDALAALGAAARDRIVERYSATRADDRIEALLTQAGGRRGEARPA